MDYKEIKRIIALMKKEELAEFEYEKDGMKLRIVRGHPAQMQMPFSPSWMTIPPKQIGLETPEKKESDVATTPIPELKKESIVQIPSPMVGTFYRAPAPDAAPFVEAGDTVELDKTLCIVEAMKLMNEIKTEFRCKIIEILVQNGHPVEFGQPLFTVEKL